MDDKDLFIKIIKHVETKGYKEHLNMLPVLPLAPTSAELLIKNVLWQRRFEIIFSHKFAKAYFGEMKTEIRNCGIQGYDFPFLINDGWELRLQQMVLEKNYLKYLEKFLPTEE